MRGDGASKFVQIAVAASDEPDQLYALDSDGNIWTIAPRRDDEWRLVTDRRFTPPSPAQDPRR